MLINEPSVEVAASHAAKIIAAGKPSPPSIIPAKDNLGASLKAYNHILLAAATAKKSFGEKIQRPAWACNSFIPGIDIG